MLFENEVHDSACFHQQCQGSEFILLTSNQPWNIILNNGTIRYNYIITEVCKAHESECVYGKDSDI